jgi:hypothetical protein
MITRFKYHATTAGLSGHIKTPFDEIIPMQASAMLPEAGGFGTAKAEAFKFRDILSFESITSVVSGARSERDKTFDALATVTIEKLNIMDVFAADKIVSRLASSHPEDGDEPCLTPVGSHFVNLRIAGHPVTVELALDSYAKFDNREKLLAAYRDNEDGFRDEFHKLNLTGKADQLHPRLKKYFQFAGSDPDRVSLEDHGTISCSLVRSITGLGSGLEACGNTVYVHGFGAIRLAQYQIVGKTRTVTMFEIDLGSVPSGGTSGGGSQGNGQGY